jgi:hypothetical protein
LRRGEEFWQRGRLTGQRQEPDEVGIDTTFAQEEIEQAADGAEFSGYGTRGQPRTVERVEITVDFRAIDFR